MIVEVLDAPLPAARSHYIYLVHPFGPVYTTLRVTIYNAASAEKRGNPVGVWGLRRQCRCLGWLIGFLWVLGRSWSAFLHTLLLGFRPDVFQFLKWGARSRPVQRERDMSLKYAGYLNSAQIFAANAYVCFERLFAFSPLITPLCDVVMAGCHVLFSTCHFTWRGTAVVCLLKQTGHCIWIKMLRCFPASSTVTQTSVTQIRDEILSIANDDCSTATVYTSRTIFKGEGCAVFSLVFDFHTVTDRHIMKPNKHGRECTICVWLCGCMCTCTKTNINLSCNDTLSSCGRFFLSPFFHLSSITVQSCIQTTGNRLFSLNKLFCVADPIQWPQRFYTRDGRSQRHSRVSQRSEI